ncbi:MAG TPA: IPT/TIG domain-containing protein [Longimicrobiaceae bacterium]|nr:IPT/TIG domain-containing protein [Longimicrobiaceae bacterium]
MADNLNSPLSVQVLAPNGGETIPAGGRTTVTWLANGNITNQRVQYSLDGVNFTPIATGLSGDVRSVPWDVPAGIVPPGQTQVQGRIRVVVRNTATGEERSDLSDAVFTLRVAGDVTAPTVQVLAPNGGETLRVGQPTMVTWTSRDDTGVVSHRVLLSLDGGATYQELSPLLVNGEQSFTFTPTAAMVTPRARIRVAARDGAGNRGTDDSNADFAIVQETTTVVVTAPAGGSVIPAGRPLTVRWQTTGPVSFHAVRLSVNGGPFENLTPADLGGSAREFTFTPTAAQAGTVVVRVAAKDASCSQVARGDSAPFTVFADTQAPAARVVSPNGGEVFTPGQTVNLQWQTSDNVGVVAHDVLFSANGGASFETVAAGLPGSQQSLPWQVPARPTPQGVIRVVARDAAGNQNGDRSDGFFTIRAAAPTLASVSPNAGPLAGGTPVTLAGQSFQPGARVSFGAAPATVSSVTPGAITAVTPPGGAAGPVAVTVSNPDGGVATLPGGFQYQPADTVLPTVTVLSPAGGETFAPGQQVLVRWQSGDNLGVVSHRVLLSTDGGASFGDLSGDLPGSAQSFPWTIPGGVQTDRARIRVAARDVAGNRGTGDSGLFAVRTAQTVPAPVIRSFSPDRGAAGTRVQIQGENFDRAPVSVRFGDAAATITAATATSLDVTVPSRAPGNVRIQVTTAGGTATSAGSFRVDSITPAVEQGCSPTIMEIDPNRATVGAKVTIRGSGFNPSMMECSEMVPSPAPEVVFNSDRSGQVRIPLGAPDNRMITVTVPNGVRTAKVVVFNTKNKRSNEVSFTLLPTISAIDEASAKVGQTITIRGTGLYDTPRFFFMGKDGRLPPVGEGMISPADDDPKFERSIRVRVPEGAVKGTVIVETLGGGRAESTQQLVINPREPIVGKFAPTSGGPGTKVRIRAGAAMETDPRTGMPVERQTEFEGVNSVSFLRAPGENGTKGERIVLQQNQFRVSGDRKEIEVDVPFGAITGKIRVTNASGSGSTMEMFRVPLLAPGNVTATPVTDGEGTRIDVVWEDRTPTNTEFQIRRRRADSSEFDRTFTRGPNEASLFDREVVPGTTYCYQVKAVRVRPNLTEESPWSNEACATAGAPLRVEPKLFFFEAAKDSAPQTQILTVRSDAPQRFTASRNLEATWLTLEPLQAEARPEGAPLSVRVEPRGLEPRATPYMATITLRAVGADGMPGVTLTIPLELRITRAASQPAIAGFSPAGGPPGTQLTLSGSNLAGATEVRLGGVSVPFTVDPTGSAIVLTVPPGAATGQLTVAAGNSGVTSTDTFTVTTASATGVVLSASPPAQAIVSGASASYTVSLARNGFTGPVDLAVDGLPAGASAELSPDPASGGSAVLTIRTTAGQTTLGTRTLTIKGSAVGAPDVVVTPATVSLAVGLAPGITGFSPAIGSEGTNVEISGANLGNATEVRFNGVPASFLVGAPSQLLASVPPGATTGPISVTNPFGTARSSQIFEITREAPPTITGFSPLSGAPGTEVQIRGTGFVHVTIVDFGGAVADFEVVSREMILATVPATALTGRIRVSTAAGTVISDGIFVVPPPAPTPPAIQSFTPASGPVGTQVTISGSNLTGATAVRFGGVGAPFTVVSPGSITATVPPGAATGPISVTTPGGSALSPGSFTVVAPASVTLSATPVSRSVTAGQTASYTINLARSNFAGAVDLSVGGLPTGATAAFAPDPTTGTASTLSVVTAAGTPAGAWTLTVSGTASGLTIAPIAVQLAVSSAAPVITAFTPTSGPVGTAVTISGSNLAGATAVRFNGVAAASFSVTSPGSIVAIVPQGATSGPISVTTPGGTATSPGSFTLPPPASVTLSAAPAAATVVAGQQARYTIGIARVSFTGAVDLEVSGLPAGASAAFSADPATGTSSVLTVTTTPSTPVGTWTLTIRATAPGVGIAPVAVGLAVGAAPPAVTGFTPVSGPVGTQVTVLGTGFAGATGVSFNGVPAQQFTVTSPGSLLATVPLGASTGPIGVTTPAGSALSAGFFSVTQPKSKEFKDKELREGGGGLLKIQKDNKDAFEKGGFEFSFLGDPVAQPNAAVPFVGGAGGLQHFIGRELRPDLSRSALRSEEDLAGPSVAN